MATLADKTRIIQYLASCPEGAELSSIAKAIDKGLDITSQLLSRLKSENKVTNPERGIWNLAKDDKEHLKPIIEEPGDIMESGADAEEPTTVPVPGAYEKFAQIGRSLGIREDFLKATCNYVFTGDANDLKYVWEALNGLYLRPDVTRRWFNMWSRVVNLPIPTEIAAQVMPSTTQAAKEAEFKSPTRFNVIGDEISADPDGEFTFTQARQYLMTRAVQGAAPSLGVEKVSDIINAIQPFLETQRTARAEEIERQGESSILATLVKSLIEQKGGSAQQPLTLADMLAVVDKIDEARRATAAAMSASSAKQLTALDELERMANVFSTMKNLFGSSERANSPITIALKGENGQMGAIPLETFFQLENHRRQVKQDEEELDNKREMGKTVRGFLDKISRAASSLASR